MLDEKRSQHVTLGCGTLILIALIVLSFSRPGSADPERDMQSLRSEVGEVKKALDSQTSEIRQLREQLHKLQPAKAGEAEANE